MVMEHPPSPQCVGREFVRQYYTLLNQAPAHLHRWEDNVFHIIYALEYNKSVALEDSVQKLETLFGKFSNMDSWIVVGNVIRITCVSDCINICYCVYNSYRGGGYVSFERRWCSLYDQGLKNMLACSPELHIFASCWEEIHANHFWWQSIWCLDFCFN